MSDFSLFSLFTAGLAFASGVAAYTKPVGDAPKGNAISMPGLNSVVPAGKPFTVTWEPTTQGTVTLVLLKGPSSNAEPQYAIVEHIPNSGTYQWTPSKDLAPTEGAEGYGIQLISDKNGQYQYTTQFGISNPNYKPDSSSSSTSEASSSSTGGPGGYGNNNNHHGHGGWGHGGHNVHGGYSHPAATGTASGWTSSYTHKSNGTTSGHAHSTGFPTHNVTMIQPTGGYTAPVPSSTPVGTVGSGASATASASAPPQATGNAATKMVTSFGGLVLAAGAVVFAL